MKKPLYHLLYTNAPGAGGTGYRHVPVSFPEGGDSAPIQKWLETLQQVEPGVSEGWAFHSFNLGIGRTLYPVMAVVNPSFSLEDHGRGRTVLVHGFVLQLSEGEVVGPFGRALYDQAKVFLDISRNDLQVTLESYLEGCRAQGDLEIPNPEPKDLCHLDGRFLRALFHAASQPVKTAQLPGVARLEDLPEQILWAGGSLPPRLRLQMRWRVGLQPGTEGFVVAPGEGETISLASTGSAFCDWLEQALQEKHFDAVRQLSENWEIRDWVRLVEAVRNPEGQRATPAVSPPPADSQFFEDSGVSGETKEMTKKPSTTRRGKPAASDSNKSAEDWDKEYQSLQKNLHEYVNNRLSHLPGGKVATSEGISGGSAPPRGGAAWFRAWRPEIYLAAVLLLLAWLHRESWPTISFSDGGAEQEGIQTTEPEPGSKSDEPEPTPASPSSSGEPLVDWGIFVNDNKAMAGAWFRALAEHRELEARQVSSEAKRKFSEWADQLDKGTALDSKDRQESLTGMFEYVHARWAQENGKGDAGKDWVTLKPEEAQRNLPALLAELNLAAQLGNEAQATDPKVQLAVVRTWLQQQPLP